MKNDIESEMAMDESMADSRVETFPTLDPETSAVVPVCQRETEETEGGGGKTKAQHDKEVKIEANAYDKDISIVNTCLIEKVNRYETHEFEEVVLDDTTKAIGQRHMEYSMIVLETSAVALSRKSSRVREMKRNRRGPGPKGSRILLA